jgi:hypothetical protein
MDEKKRRKFKVSMCMRLKYIMCPKQLSRKDGFFMKIYQKASNIINNKMDMINYLKFMKEYIHVKCLLFNDVHSLCLSFIQKPKVYEKNRFVKINSQSHKKLKDIITYFNSKKSLSKKDKEMFDLLSREVKKMIEHFK